jgi:citronellol/citronellal dehydrogenase
MTDSDEFGPKRFAGQRAVVTGASRGIGAGVAERLAADGADVAIVARTLDEHPTLAGSLNAVTERMAVYGGLAVPIVADLADPDDRGRIIPEAEEGLGGPIDILINNAAAGIYQPLVDFPLRRFRLTFAVNVEAPLELMQAVIPGMLAAGRGWIVNLSSAAARPKPVPATTAGDSVSRGVYGASKAALNRLTNAMGDELWGRGVRVNTIEPRAAVLTELASALVGVVPDDRFESVEEMAAAVVALCDCPPERTGQSIVSLDLLAELGVNASAQDHVR